MVFKRAPISPVHLQQAKSYHLVTTGSSPMNERLMACTQCASPLRYAEVARSAG